MSEKPRRIIRRQGMQGKTAFFTNFVVKNMQTYVSDCSSTVPLNEMARVFTLQQYFELDCVNTFLDNGRKPPCSVILWPLEGHNLAKVTQKKSILNTHPISVHQVWNGLFGYVF